MQVNDHLLDVPFNAELSAMREEIVVFSDTSNDIPHILIFPTGAWANS